MFDIPKPVLVLAAILAIAAGLGILVFTWQFPEGPSFDRARSFDRAVWAGGGVFLLVAGLISSAILWKTRGGYFED